jgi:DNA-binding XRE family transcriptional regulator
LPDSGHQCADLVLLGRAVRQMREQRYMSPDELADTTGTSRQRIDAIETGRLDPSYALLLALTEGLRTQPAVGPGGSSRATQGTERAVTRASDGREGCI